MSQLEIKGNLDNSDDNDDDDTTVLLEFFRQATQSLNQLMTLYQQKSVYRKADVDKPYIQSDHNSDNHSISSNNGSYNTNNDDDGTSWKNVSEIRQLLLSQQLECLQSSIDACRSCKQNNSISDDYTVTTLQNALQALNKNNRNTTTISSSSSTIQFAMEQMNDMARKTFCYLILWYEFQYDIIMTNIDHTTTTTATNQLPHRTLISSSSSLRHPTTTKNNNNTNNTNHHMKSPEVLEFCGLCNTAIRIIDVIRYIQYGTPMFPNMWMNNDDDDDAITSQTNGNHNARVSSQQQPFEFPQQRLQHIQRLLLRAIGYDPDYGTTLIQEMFYVCPNSVEIDANVISTFRHMEQCMEQTLMDITNNITKETFFDHHKTNTWNDTDPNNSNDDVTRIVAVTYSEKYIDAKTGHEIMTIHPDDHGEDWNGAPRSFVMMTNNDTLTSTTTTTTTSTTTYVDERVSASQSQPNTNSHNELIQKATSLQQEILGELLSMREEEREMKLMKVNEIVQNVLDHISTFEQPHDRILYLKQLDANTQRCMAMKKIWDALLADHDNQAPRTMY